MGRNKTVILLVFLAALFPSAVHAADRVYSTTAAEEAALAWEVQRRGFNELGQPRATDATLFAELVREAIRRIVSQKTEIEKEATWSAYQQLTPAERAAVDGTLKRAR